MLLALEPWPFEQPNRLASNCPSALNERSIDQSVRVVYQYIDIGLYHKIGFGSYRSLILFAIDRSMEKAIQLMLIVRSKKTMIIIERYIYIVCLKKPVEYLNGNIMKLVKHTLKSRESNRRRRRQWRPLTNL